MSLPRSCQRGEPRRPFNRCPGSSDTFPMRLVSVPVRLAVVAAILCLVVPAATAASSAEVASVGTTCGGGLVPVGDGLCTHGEIGRAHV